MNKVFPTILIVLNFAASAVYLFDGDWRKTAYWFAAGVLNLSITY